jgi:High potential iron-sulfur protein
MKPLVDESRREFLYRAPLGIASVALVGLPLPAARAADLPLVTADDPTGKALKYVSDASQASVTRPGSKCANCANYQGAAGSTEGGCLLFPGKAVQAAGWCSGWTAKK